MLELLVARGIEQVNHVRFRMFADVGAGIGHPTAAEFVVIRPVAVCVQKGNRIG